ncbi:tetratricopeptide repeat protein [Lysinibacillus sp. NPDC097287]|uniref:tetratricopeptide repeat protein n=1 Tax=Lysinibacillus sp. NPDC097287 TaxID=3364144 RepID=UPI0037FCA4BE
MAKHKRPIIKHDNIIVFPGAAQKLIKEGHHYAEEYQYEKAVECFEKAFLYEEGDETALSAYAYALYELKEYEKAKAVCAQLLAMGTSLYVEVMELYITVSMQLKEYHQVEALIDALIEENALPPAQLEKFERLKDLNIEVAKNLQQKEDTQTLIEEQEYELARFCALEPNKQAMLLHRLMDSNIRQLKQELKEIIESENIHPFVQSLALILLVEQEVSIEVNVTKFAQTKTVNPSQLQLPTQLPQYAQVKEFVENKLEQDPTMLEMVQYLMAKHAIVTYPFEWLPFEADDIAYSYIDFVQSMLGKVQEMNYEIIDFLQMLEKLTELQDV